MMITKWFCPLLCTIAFTAGNPFSLSDIEEWENYKIKFNKLYPTEDEDNIRMKYFLEKKKEIEHHNLLYLNGTKTFQKGINRFSDLTLTELLARPLEGLLGGPGLKAAALPNDTVLPDSVDWRSAGGVTAVKDQGDCGACYAFAATGALEAKYFLKTGKLVPFSEQQLIDCSTEAGNLGCHGGWVDRAFEYLKSSGGIHNEESYPFRGQEGGCQNKTSSEYKIRITGYVDLPKGDERALQAAVATQGPVAVRIDAQDSFADYSSGVYLGEDCSSSEHNHAALVVGYGSSGGSDFWLVKNSWGRDWGEGGYIRMSRGRGNNCGISSSASYPLVE